MQKNPEIFLKLFGVKPAEIKSTCIITPFRSGVMAEAFHIKDFSKGLLYSVGQAENFTLVISRMGSGFVGDSVLYLENTELNTLFFLGSGGALDKKGIDIGDLTLAEKAYIQDSFTGMLLYKEIIEEYYSDKGLLNEIFRSEFGNQIKKTVCASLGSLKLEEQYLKKLNTRDIAVVDMEAAAFLAAAQNIHKKAAAFIYVTDILGIKPYYDASILETKKTILSSSKTLLKIINYLQLL